MLACADGPGSTDTEGVPSLMQEKATPDAVAAGYATRMFGSQRRPKPIELEPADLARRAWALAVARAALDSGLDRTAVVHLLGVAPGVLDELLDGSIQPTQGVQTLAEGERRRKPSGSEGCFGGCLASRRGAFPQPPVTH